MKLASPLMIKPITNSSIKLLRISTELRKVVVEYTYGSEKIDASSEKYIRP